MTFFLAFLCLKALTQEVQLEQPKAKTAADYYWDTMPKRGCLSSNPDGTFSPGPDLYEISQIPNNGGDKNQQEILIRNEMNTEIYSRLLREWGIGFWKRFPDDPRRFNWLASTIVNEPTYFANIRYGAQAKIGNEFVIPLDTVSKKLWELEYKQFRREFLESSQVMDANKRRFLQFELSQYQFRMRSQITDKLDFAEFMKMAEQYLKTYDVEDKDVVSILAICFSQSKRMGFDDLDLKKNILTLQKSVVPSFRELANQMKSLQSLKERPLELSSTSTNGKKIDLKDYRGKLVLVDFWSLGCGTCVAKMPEIKEVYEKYKGRGFEVISACFVTGRNSKGAEFYKDEHTQIKNIYKKIGADWPLVLLGTQRGELGMQIKETYAFYKVPQLLLLDENGKLISYNGDMNISGKLDKIVDNYLKNKLKN